MKISDEDIVAWADRHDIQGTKIDMRCAFEDAATLHLEKGEYVELVPVKYECGKLSIEQKKQIDGSVKWAIYDSFQFVFNKYLEWEYEPAPSDRDKAFINRARFNSLEEAVSVIRLVTKKENT